MEILGESQGRERQTPVGPVTCAMFFLADHPFAGPSAQLLPPPTTSLLAARRPWYQLWNH